MPAASFVKDGVKYAGAFLDSSAGGCGPAAVRPPGRAALLSAPHSQQPACLRFVGAVGDSIFVESEEALPYIAKVLGIASAGGGTYKLTVSWYYRPEDSAIPGGRKVRALGVGTGRRARLRRRTLLRMLADNAAAVWCSSGAAYRTLDGGVCCS